MTHARKSVKVHSLVDTVVTLSTRAISRVTARGWMTTCLLALSRRSRRSAPNIPFPRFATYRVFHCFPTVTPSALCAPRWAGMPFLPLAHSQWGESAHEHQRRRPYYRPCSARWIWKFTRFPTAQEKSLCLSLRCTHAGYIFIRFKNFR